jgi:TfoX/Sxy family transcriptional regulator of competence genes
MRRKSAGTAALAEGALDPLLQPIRRAFAEDEEVSVGRVLSANGLMVKGKLFAAISKGRLLVKLPREDVAALIADKGGAPFTTGGGRVMKEWATIGVDRRESWLEIARRARQFVAWETRNKR